MQLNSEQEHFVKNAPWSVIESEIAGYLPSKEWLRSGSQHDDAESLTLTCARHAVYVEIEKRLRAENDFIRIDVFPVGCNRLRFSQEGNITTEEYGRLLAAMLCLGLRARFSTVVHAKSPVKVGDPVFNGRGEHIGIAMSPVEWDGKTVELKGLQWHPTRKA